MSFLTDIKSLWIIIIILIVINMVSLGAIWLSKDHRPYYRSGSNPRIERGSQPSGDQHFIPRELNFTEDQQIKFDSLASLHRGDLSIKTDEIRILREQLVDRMKNQEFDSTSEDLIQEIGKKQAELELMNFRNFRNILNICNDSQKDKFIVLMQRAFRPRHGDYERNGSRGRPDSRRN